ncbi:G-D-S-L family lipolytic protein [Paenibacillus sp. FSL R7-269]|uniref:SGNH/GDSL hydrolase family protein n=1 Tax=Paenibacillus sp. FSL R7-269 TaxID=1226755 RepID=UPI0003E273D2|nr:SGNH/GDSL hydrolase family protein [Paenibacillus sp. FSL R7-269]ETT56384.1 G-D-S-L family lipolytic protein [Paenibacillus sp. FSL R7-269]
MRNVLKDRITRNNRAPRILFLGDSITADGQYIRLIREWLNMHRPEWTAELIPSGVPSETVSGLSEAAHPYPRPCVHERLARELAEAAPDMVIACYGMNDGIYHPFSEERFAAYQAGMLALSTRVGEAGAGIVLMTPPPFDALSMKGELQPADAADFSYLAPYKDYDQVLEHYADWLLSGGCPADKVIDLRTPLLELIRHERSQNTAYRYGDGIHPDTPGHRVIARTLLRELSGGEPELQIDKYFGAGL